jgi:type IV secretory pathway TraG/TraD family ATPase VirD4
MANAPYEVELGVAHARDKKLLVGVAHADRFRHAYMIGKTGVGKSTLYQNMALQDIRAGRGIVFVDPHGEAIDYLISVIPKNRIDDVVLFDPSNVETPTGMNLLEWRTPDEKDFLVSEAIQIFYKIFDPEQTGIIGPQFEHWMRSAALTVMAQPDGGTLLDIPRLFIDKQYERTAVAHVHDPAVLDFWGKQMAKTSDFHRSEMLNYFSSKFGRFVSNTTMANIIGQPHSAFSIADAIAAEKIVLINLCKGKIGETNSQMLGLILMAKLQAAVLGRAALPEPARVPCYLYVDEFQNVLTDAFISMLSESRKYGLAVHLTNQYIEQLPEKIRSAVMGNIGTFICFQVGAADAEFLKIEMAPIDEGDLQNVPLHSFYLKGVMNGVPFEPFLVSAFPPQRVEAGDNYAEVIKTVSSLKYGQLIG